MEVNLKCVCELLINAKILLLIDCFKYIFTLFIFLSLLLFSVFLFFCGPSGRFPSEITILAYIY